MIESIQEQHTVVRCAICEQPRDLRLEGLQVKTLDATTAVVALPSCACGAVEYLVRAVRPEHPEPGSQSHRHQLLVDHLHAELVRTQRISADSKDARKVCPPVSPDVLARWFPDGLSVVEDALP